MHTPAFGDVVIVGLEEHLIVHHSAEQLGALRGPKQHGVGSAPRS